MLAEIQMDTTMNAAVVTNFDEPPHYMQTARPTTVSPDQVLIDVIAAGLHPRVRSGAGGRHYTSTGDLPMVPGIDGVGRRVDDGALVYFACDDEVSGSMCERAIAEAWRIVELPEDVDVAAVAAAMNPAMSSWVALRRKRPLRAGESVLILGATGNAGRMAVQVAKLLGAGTVVAAGRDPERLRALSHVGADALVRLGPDPEQTSADLADAAADVDVVIDYLWAQPAELAMKAVLMARQNRSEALDWIQIGALAGPTLALPSVYLRSANLRIQGNGQGSTSAADYVAQLPALVEQIAAGTVTVTARTTALRDVEAAWTQEDAPGERTVLIV
jgi:NADPH:quinone reductase-like Zn-dependent oxidoreductase